MFWGPDGIRDNWESDWVRKSWGILAALHRKEIDAHMHLSLFLGLCLSRLIFMLSVTLLSHEMSR